MILPRSRFSDTLVIVGALSASILCSSDGQSKSERQQSASANSKDVKASSSSSAKSPLFANPQNFKLLQKSIQNTGNPVVAADYPWQLSIRIHFGQQSWRCGGTLISPRYVLTAAHCLDGAAANDLASTIRIGLNDIEVFSGSDHFGEGTKLALATTWPVTFHPQWKKAGQAYAWDAALLKLASPLNVRFASASSIAVGEVLAVTSGWGSYDTSNQPSILLRAVALPVVTNDKCRASLPLDARGAVGNYTLCAVSRVDDSCSRDSGGPLVVGPVFRPQLIGIVSWGLSRSCGVSGPTGLLVGAYTRVSEIAPWIRSVTGDADAVTDQPLKSVFGIQQRNDM